MWPDGEATGDNLVDLGGSSERTARTVPLRWLRTQPASPSARPVSTDWSQKMTPCT
ncbi:hypothetical protein ACP70R_018469 [Stipagrostis hirtigluma subsp. patula]